MSAALALVAALGENGVIGVGDRLPFRLPSDLKRFRALTWGKPLLMGRKTFVSIGRPLPGRETIVVTRDKGFAAPAGVHLAFSPEDALSLAITRAAAMGADEIILAGGGELYAALLPRVARMYLTLVEASPPGDALFPAVDWTDWIETERLRPEPQAGDEAKFAFVRFERKLKFT
ncbi:dihydrofolate reductase [Methylocella silvestris]|uniref:Dihydrofolate reductase n=1 Tax=Methylocella silvestris TaxID=199596 RepID=A0A2J7TED5_METSI|nr:dihydrofolate reductase [Methylocella silvestris]PNG25137.1 diacylglycerol kinase [Methylocella silvestris]